MTKPYTPSDKCKELIFQLRECTSSLDAKTLNTLEFILKSLDQHWEVECRALRDYIEEDCKPEIESLKKENRKYKSLYKDYKHLNDTGLNKLEKLRKFDEYLLKKYPDLDETRYHKELEKKEQEKLELLREIKDEIDQTPFGKDDVHRQLLYYLSKFIENKIKELEGEDGERA